MNISTKIAVPLIFLGGMVAAPVFADQNADQSNNGQQMGQSQSSLKGSVEVREIQQYLNNHGYHAGKVDGQWGSRTSAAVKRFQQAKGLKPTGQLDDQTLAQMNIGGGRAPASSNSNNGSSMAPGAQQNPIQPGGSDNNNNDLNNNDNNSNQ
jgi:peptidoglycan hydrolase-like protein with peptidoglycan-binding domain